MIGALAGESDKWLDLVDHVSNLKRRPKKSGSVPLAGSGGASNSPPSNCVYKVDFSPQNFYPEAPDFL